MNSLKSKRGSVLITALLLSGLIAIAISSYIAISLTTLKIAKRSVYSNAAMNLVDFGLEQALWCLNNGDTSTVWGDGGFSVYNSNEWLGTFSPPTSALNPGETASVKVWYQPSTLRAVAKATVTFAEGGQAITKEAEMYVKQSSYFSNGLVAKTTITFSGNNASVDSWNSNPNNLSPDPSPIAYSSSVATDAGKIGSTSVNVDSITVSNADINGYAAVGGSSSSDISVGPQGYVGPYGTPDGTINPSYVTYDFTTSFPNATAPSGYTANLISSITAAKTLPGAGDIASSDGKYYYTVSNGINLSGRGDTLSVASSSNVVFVLPNTTGDDISVSGNGGINIASGSSLVIYAAGNASIGGNGLVNGGSTDATANPPIDFQLYGTSTTSQSISIAGNGVLSGVVYAPNASISLSGGGNNGQVMGAIVGNSVSVTGNSQFHYDSSLANFSSSNLWKLSKWRELYVASDQYSQLN